MEPNIQSPGPCVSENFENSRAMSETSEDSDFLDVKTQHESDEEPEPKGELSSGSESETVSQSEDDYYYKTENNKRGKAVIFNHMIFKRLSLKSRESSELDCERLAMILGDIGFEVNTHNDLTLSALCDELERLQNLSYKDCNCLIIVVLTHGGPNELHAQNSSYSADFLFDHFLPSECPTLEGKPKIFILEACRGTEEDVGQRVQHGEENESDSPDSANTGDYEKQHSDFLYAYASPPGHVAWLNSKKGSWFIQSLCQELEENWKNYDFDQILTFVCRRVSYEFETRHKRKQATCFTSQLTRILTFSTKYEENNSFPVPNQSQLVPLKDRKSVFLDKDPQDLTSSTDKEDDRSSEAVTIPPSKEKKKERAWIKQQTATEQVLDTHMCILSATQPPEPARKRLKTISKGYSEY